MTQGQRPVLNAILGSTAHSCAESSEVAGLWNKFSVKVESDSVGNPRPALQSLRRGTQEWTRPEKSWNSKLLAFENWSSRLRREDGLGSQCRFPSCSTERDCQALDGITYDLETHAAKKPGSACGAGHMKAPRLRLQRLETQIKSWRRSSHHTIRFGFPSVCTCMLKPRLSSHRLGRLRRSRTCLARMFSLCRRMTVKANTTTMKERTSIVSPARLLSFGIQTPELCCPPTCAYTVSFLSHYVCVRHCLARTFCFYDEEVDRFSISKCQD